jgi:hypothetical protein
MEEIEILPRVGNSVTDSNVSSPLGCEYSMSIRDYQSLSNSNLKVNRKKTNRIMGNRKRAPSEKDKDNKRKRALGEIFDIISEQEENDPNPTDEETKHICLYQGREIQYVKRSKR